MVRPRAARGTCAYVWAEEAEMEWLYDAPPAVPTALFLVLALLGSAGGWRLGVRLQSRADDRLLGQVGAVQAAVLALLGLLLAFSFSMSVDRFEQRRVLVVKEANAIGTAWLRADALPPEPRAEVERLLRGYVDARLVFYRAGEEKAGLRAAVDVSEGLQGELWGIASREAVAAPDSLPRALLLEALNAVIDVHAERVAAHDAHVPDSVFLLLVGVGAAGIALVGFAFGLVRGPYLAPCVLLAGLTAGILYVILDLDQPRRGHIRVSQESLESLRRSLDER